MKCNYDPTLLRTLASLGTGFDCASKQEIVTILNLGVDPSRIIYANPCKQNSHIRLAVVTKVTLGDLPRVLSGAYRIRGLFGGDFNLAVWRIFIGSPNLNHAVLTRTHKMN